MASDAEYVVVIGASAGGFSPLYELIGQLKPDTNAAFLIVLHLSYRSIGGYLAYKLQEHTRLKCVLAMDDLPLKRGYIYVAVPNHHLLVMKDHMKLGSGPHENRWRPSIDVLFRTAATAYTTRVIGIVMTGLLNDGTSGMSAIKRCGGVTIVQDPNEAEYPDMPLSVIKSMEVDYCVPVAEMGRIIESITSKHPGEEKRPPDDLLAEHEMYNKMITSVKSSEPWGANTSYTCPDCGGVLFRHEQDSIVKMKCHTGHSFSLRDLMLKQSEELESSLWYAIRSLEQKKDLLESLCDKYEKTGGKRFAENYKKRINEINTHLKNLKSILTNSLNDSQEEPDI
jgi:two-component system, chemotaxis family, protein-glutamate methylesterase/glutaminase